jgi:hypothetical protein
MIPKVILDPPHPGKDNRSMTGHAAFDRIQGLAVYESICSVLVDGLTHAPVAG